MENRKIKLFGPNTKQKLEDEMNAFMETLDAFYIDQVGVNVAKNYLPHTALAEYAEDWYGYVTYSENVNE